ncbi:uncharacterized protein F5Z01DRAFT_690444 [Emericellopsis atlantica]|uniref:Aminoglycoside phosphotransferase domain-containing protein n=1 Tax=Emericellopsis atlantica TaxID=2614577 RepID=A0A9P8CN47_9HYPO|nr:uncharacterized protein F5Z01DRAFT_690444 [Emericellopsis atlantica]KAG9252690.1 hypothetical protein F5Z01DRAFT_690444 [Emericellopsis atlantica]
MAAMSAKQTEEEGWIATTFERKYYHRERVLIKRSLRPNEYRTGFRGLHVPRLGKERLMNEAKSLQFIQQHTDIPVPTVYCYFEDDGAYYLITEYIEGVSMSELPEGQKAVVSEELESHLAKLKTLKSCRLGDIDYWHLRASSQDTYVFCIIDWEYAGFFPPRFEYPFHRRLGPSSAIKGEVDDSFDLLQFLQSEASHSS